MIIRNKDKFVAKLLTVFNNSSDVLKRDFEMAGGLKASVVFLDSVSDAQAQRALLERLTDIGSNSQNAVKDLVNNVITTFGATEIKTIDDAENTLLIGDTVLVIDGQNKALAIATAKWPTRGISEPPTSSVLRGPREGFTETLKTNITQLRRKLQTPDLVFDRLTVGKYTRSDIAVAYISSVADPYIVERIKERLAKINIDGVLESSYLQEYLEEHNSMFAQVGVYEKPDIIAGKLLEGRIAVMLNGTPMVLTLPYLLFEDLQQSEDYYTSPARATFLRVLRIAALLIGVFLPGVYVSLEVFHYTIIPLNFLYTMLNAIQGLPMRPNFELLFALILFEIIHEASVRMPRYVGMAMSIVGALVMGDTAVKAGLISSPTIMIVALSSIAVYTVPTQSDAMRNMRMLICLLGGFAGLWAIILFALGVLVHLAAMDSYGTPYLAPFAPYIKNDLKDALGKGRLLEMTSRPKAIPNINNTRQKN